MKFHVKFQGFFWYFEISYKNFGEYFGFTGNQRERDQFVTRHFSRKFDNISNTRRRNVEIEILIMILRQISIKYRNTEE